MIIDAANLTPSTVPVSTTLRLLLCPGDPAGIGPDIVLEAMQSRQTHEWVVAADPEVLLQRAEQLGLPCRIRAYRYELPPTPTAAGELCVHPLKAATAVKAGQPDSSNAGLVLDALALANKGCQNGEFSALVTGPANKAVIMEAGFAFSGHTEWLADLAGVAKVVMLLACPQLRVALATTHLPLRDVADAIQAEPLAQVLRITHKALVEEFGLHKPLIMVAGLNPHAGEGGHLGREEIEVIQPTLAQLRQEGLNLEGPLPADTLFTPPYLKRADAVLAMYHDQGLPVLKHLGFGTAVNITLGLPYIRTSVDHGTAFDLAGSGRAEHQSLLAAMESAVELASRKYQDRERRNEPQ